MPWRFAQEIQEKVREQAGLSIGNIEKIATLKHGVTRFRITLDCYRPSHQIESALARRRMAVDCARRNSSRFRSASPAANWRLLEQAYALRT